MVARVQNNGLARITSLLAAASWWIHFGVGSGAAASANALNTTGVTEARVAATTSQQTATVTNDKLRFTGTITALGARAITEAGVFDALTSGNLDVYGDFSVINLANGDSIAFTIEVTFA